MTAIQKSNRGLARRLEGSVAWLRPPMTLRAIGTATPWLLSAAVLLCAAGLAVGLASAPAHVGVDAANRIGYVHLPATWVALALYALLVFWSCVRLTTGLHAASMMTEALAPTGALFALLALWTGSLWSKATSDLWWSAHAGSTLDAALLAAFVACAFVREAVEDASHADRVAAILALAGAVVIGGLLYSTATERVSHAGAELIAPANDDRLKKSAALVLVTAGFVAYATAAALKRLRCVILERERACGWVVQPGAPQ